MHIGTGHYCALSEKIFSTTRKTKLKQPVEITSIVGYIATKFK